MMVLGTRHYFAPFSPSTWKSPHGPVWLSNNWTFMKLTNPALPSPEHNSISHTNASIFHMITNTLDVLVHFVANQRKIVFCAIVTLLRVVDNFVKSHSSRWVYTTVNDHPHYVPLSIHTGAGEFLVALSRGALESPIHGIIHHVDVKMSFEWRRFY